MHQQNISITIKHALSQNSKKHPSYTKYGITSLILAVVITFSVILASQSARSQEATSKAGMSVFDQLSSLLLIVENAETIRLAEEYLALTSENVAVTSERVKIGEAWGLDVTEAQALHINAQLGLNEAKLRHVLAIDAYENKFGTRVEKPAIPDLQPLPARGLLETISQVATEKRDEARRYWHQLRFANEALSLEENLVTVAQERRDLSRKAHEMGIITYSEAVRDEIALIRARDAVMRRKFNKVRAEAWLLAETGKLSASTVTHSGR